MSPDDRWRLTHMADAVASAQKFAQKRRRTDLDDDEMLLFALVRALEIIGEAAAQVSPEGKAELSDWPWAAMIGMRNRMVHAYFDIDRDIVWNTVTDALPPLVDRLQKALGR